LKDLGQNVGECIYLGGEAVSVDIPPPGSARAYEMTFEILDSSAEEMFYRLNPETGTYEFDEEMERDFYGGLSQTEGVIDITDAVTIPAEEKTQDKLPLSENVLVTVYKDTLGYGSDHDNLTEILVPSNWLYAELERDNISIAEWFDTYTADDTENIARKALAENQVLDCLDPFIKSKLPALAKPGLAQKIQNAQARTTGTNTAVAPPKEKTDNPER
jgi:hypothetical protein